jgi:hypothetical protein
MEKEKALERYIRCQQSLKAVLANIPEDRIITTTVEGAWTVKELLCHFIGWDRTLLDPLQTFVEKGDFPVRVFSDHDSYNASQTSSRLGLSLESIIQELEETSQQLLHLVASLDQNQCQVNLSAPWGGESTIPAMLFGLAWHVDDHLKHVRAAFDLSQDGKF